MPSPTHRGLVLVVGLTWALAAQLSFGPVVSAGVVLDSNGFESPYVAGQLEGQHGWVAAGTGGSTAVVQSAVVKDGSQAVRVDRAASASADRRWAVPVTGLPTERFISIEWDMRVSETSSTGFGPFFGVEAYDYLGDEFYVDSGVLGSLGVDASTGDVLYQVQGSGALAESGTLATFDQWHHFHILLDFADQAFYGYVDGALVATTGFVDGTGLTDFTDADIATFAASPDPVSQSLPGTAYFDNFRVVQLTPGDYDMDGLVDAADYGHWKATYGAATIPAGAFADGNANGIVDAADYTIWRDVSSAGAGAAGLPVKVPEPLGLWLACCATLFAPGLARRRRKDGTRHFGSHQRSVPGAAHDAL